LASADALVRAALRQGIDPGELAMMALPLGGGLGRSSSARAIPLGFADEAAFASFARDLSVGLREAGYGDVVPVVQGSSVTGVKYTTGAPFDVGRRSDFDIALASPTLFVRAKAAGVKLRSSGPSRTAPLKPRDLERLGLLELAERLSAGVDRDVHFMVYEHFAGAIDRSGGIRLP
jgi:filamentous hemagglutinin